MTDMSNLIAQFTTAIKSELDERETAAAARKAGVELITAILAKPILHLPEDLMSIAGCEKSTAYKIMTHCCFPMTFTLGRQRFCRTADFMDALPMIGEKTKTESK